MKTVRILLYPDVEQTRIMEKLVDEYVGYLKSGLGADRSVELIGKYPTCLCESSRIQLEYDIRRRRNKEILKKMKSFRGYCRWGSDYHLLEDKVNLPLGEAFENLEMSIACVFRPFQILLLCDRHPATLTLKRMKNHWFAYLLVEDFAR